MPILEINGILSVIHQRLFLYCCSFGESCQEGFYFNLDPKCDENLIELRHQLAIALVLVFCNDTERF